MSRYFWHLRLYSSTFTIFMAASSRRSINSLRDLVVCDESLSKRSSISSFIRTDTTL